MKNLKKWLPIIMATAGILCLILGILLLAVVVPNSDLAYKKVIGVICAVLLFIMVLLIGAYFYLGRDTDANFFLYDRSKRKNIPVEKLNNSIINERMTFFLTMICDRFEELWDENLLEDSRKFGYRSIYRPLVVYKMLYELGDKDNDEYWNCLLNASPAVIDDMSRILRKAGEGEMVTHLLYILENYRSDDGKIKDFIRGNKAYISRRMKEFVKKYIEYFY